MSVFIKPKMKALKEALAKKDWPGVEKNASAVLDFESSNYNARVFLALALFNLGKPEESEETYKKAIEQSPTQPLARQGLATLYEKNQRWTDYARELQGLMHQDAPKYAESLEKLLDLIETLSLLLPSSHQYPIFRTLPIYDPTSPTATSYPTVQQAVTSPLRTLLEIIAHVSGKETAAVDAEIKKRRQRLGGPALTAEETTRQVQAEMLPQSRLPTLWRQVLDDPDAGNDETLRRGIERQLLAHLRMTLRALPSSFDPPSLDLSAKAKTKAEKQMELERDAKDAYRAQVEDLTHGMVVIGVPDGSAWEVEVEWSDRFADGAGLEGLTKENRAMLRRLSDIFPEAGISRISRVVLARLEAAEAAARPPIDGNPAEPPQEEPPQGPTEDECAEIIEDGLAKAPQSVVAHLLAASFFRSQKEWDAVLQVAEAGLSVLTAVQIEIGRALPRTRRALETSLAFGLVHHDPPTRHLRALRLIENLLATPPPPPSSPSVPVLAHPDPELLFSKAIVLQTSEKQAAAIQVWDQILALPADSLSADKLIKAKCERAWSTHLAGSSEDALPQLEEVVASLEERRTIRDTEREEREKYRSKRSLEKPVGVEEGEQPEERQERATAWWRLGECLWKLGASTADRTQQAYDAYIAALRASPSYAPAFTSLGIYYRALAPPDWERSSKCFQKAFEVDPSQEVAARYLAEEFAELGEWNLVEVIARRVIDGNKGRAGMSSKATARLAWAWKAIGGSELNSKKYPQAITAFQSALRGAPDDVSTWIKLGVAYRQSGKHVAALKVFVKALTLDPSSWFTKYSIADVQREIGLLDPAIKTFNEILVDRPDELGVKVVYAETALVKGLGEQKKGYTVRAEESLLEALHASMAVIEGESTSRVAWKVTAEALVGLSRLSDPASPNALMAPLVRVLNYLSKQDIDGKMVGMTAVTVADVRAADNANPAITAAALAVLSFKMRVLLETQNEAAIGSAWFDLGVAISNFRPHLSALLTSQTTADQALQQAIRCLKYALHKEPLNASFWNALGVLSFDLSPRLAQHSFIRSIEHNSRSAVPWTNLGLFYLVHGDEELANQAFLKAQVLDPDWAAAWVGQSTLADMAGHAVEASVLLEHAVSLGGDAPEADIAFASRAFDKYRSSVPSSSVSVADPSPAPPPSATDVLSAPLLSLGRYLSQYPSDHTALHLNALILEQIGDLASACEMFEQAAAIIEELYEVDESPAVEGQYVIAQTNLGRARLAAQQYSGALEAFEASLSLLNLEDSPARGGLTKEQSVLLFTECKLGSSIAHVALGKLSAAKEALETAIDDVEPYRVGACGDHLAVALGRVHWAEGEEDRALSALLDSPDMPQGRQTPLFLRRAMYAYAIAANDASLLQTTDTFTWNAAVKYDSDISHLSMLAKLAKGDVDGALSTVSRTLHAFPWAPTFRSRSARLLTSLPPVASDATAVDNLEFVGRLMRTRVPQSEASLLRARRSRALGIVALHKAGKAEKEEEADRLDEEALRFLERSVYAVPWDTEGREALQKLRAKLEL
ncbi:antiviral protein SKI3 [Rhodotorula toruloides]|uniref:Antiviral protein SKI3 n=1 Tax=Rhodotorula toruloides TaxID=5286 RepID=A0A511KA02_RHOTO|nr:antiviral protein SKI3 [Rhodotorula toruloides]